MMIKIIKIFINALEANCYLQVKIKKKRTINDNNNNNDDNNNYKKTK